MDVLFNYLLDELNNDSDEDFDEDFDASFALGFGNPNRFFFNSGNTKDMNPVFWQELKKDRIKEGFTCYRATVRSVGVNPEDVKVELCEDSIKVSGETDTRGIKYDFNYPLPISKEIVSDIDSIKYDSVNGMTYIYLYVKVPEKKQIKIEKL